MTHCKVMQFVEVEYKAKSRAKMMLRGTGKFHLSPTLSVKEREEYLGFSMEVSVGTVTGDLAVLESCRTARLTSNIPNQLPELIRISPHCTARGPSGPTAE